MMSKDLYDGYRDLALKSPELETYGTVRGSMCLVVRVSLGLARGPLERSSGLCPSEFRWWSIIRATSCESVFLQTH